MLPKENRITDNYDFNRIRRLGKTYSSGIFLFSFFVDNGKRDKGPRLGMIVTNRVDKRATVRHRLKRLLSRVLYENLSRFPNGGMGVFVVRSSMIGKKYEEISVEFNRVLSKIPLS